MKTMRTKATQAPICTAAVAEAETETKVWWVHVGPCRGWLSSLRYRSSSIMVATMFNNDYDMDVSQNSGTPKSSILIVISMINHPFWGTPIFGNIHMIFGFEKDMVQR